MIYCALTHVASAKMSVEQPLVTELDQFFTKMTTHANTHSAIKSHCVYHRWQMIWTFLEETKLRLKSKVFLFNSIL